MKLKTQIAALAVLALPLVVSTAAEKSAKKMSAPAATTYKVDASQSKISWLGKKVTGQHNGTIGIKSGTVNVENGNVSSAKIVVDPATIVVEDLTGEYKGKLEGHLKSDDFFGAAKNPEIIFEITKVDAAGADGMASVTGNLTIKGKTNPVTFPAKINVASDKVTATATGIAVDRTLYDIRYGSGKFFQGLGDKVINDQFWLDFSIVAVK